MGISKRILMEIMLSDGTPLTEATAEQLRAEAARERALAQEHADRADNLLIAAINRAKPKR